MPTDMSLTRNNLLIDNKNILTVEKLNNLINSELQQKFGAVYVEGEISNLVKPASGHMYFTLKDSKSQIRCALFKGFRRFIKAKIENGQKVLVKANISIYVPRGDYQLIVEHVYPTGLGALQQAYEELKKKLKSEGLFNKEYKKSIPKLPQTIYVITSPTGAAVRDIITTLYRRFPSIPVKIIPSLVQGETAAKALTKAVQIADKIANQKTDVIIIARGGGSLEDLWAFNDENLARTIFAAQTPIISGIGHEIDFTIADFVADIRAATPTAAAETASPDWQEYMSAVLKQQQNLFKTITNKFFQLTQVIQNLNHRLLQQHPETKLQHQAQRLDDIIAKLTYSWDKIINKNIYQLKILTHKLEQNSPKSAIKIQQNYISSSKKLMINHVNNLLQNSHNNLKNIVARLNSVNPLEILARGYSVITDENDKIITNSSSVKTGDRIHAKLAHGSLDCEVL